MHLDTRRAIATDVLAGCVTPGTASDGGAHLIACCNVLAVASRKAGRGDFATMLARILKIHLAIKAGS